MITALRAVCGWKPVRPFSLVAASVLLMPVGCTTPERAQSAMAPPAVPVSTGIAVEETVPIEIQSVGTVEPFMAVEVKPQVGGQLLNARFVEGADVSKGDLLFEIDPRTYRAALRQDGEPAGPSGQRGESQRYHLDRDQPDRSDLRRFRRSGAPARHYCCEKRGAPASGAGIVRGRRQNCPRNTNRDRQQG